VYADAKANELTLHLDGLKFVDLYPVQALVDVVRVHGMRWCVVIVMRHSQRVCLTVPFCVWCFQSRHLLVFVLMASWYARSGVTHATLRRSLRR